MDGKKLRNPQYRLECFDLCDFWNSSAKASRKGRHVTDL